MTQGTDRGTSAAPSWPFDANEVADRLQAVPASSGMEGKRSIVVEVVDALLAYAATLDGQEAPDSKDGGRPDHSR
ncbi:hypothetical protein [Sphingomonas sp. 1P08PE]|uniref:hypothetical protein n=1 Tax=Sphingomonas sp. 1P08PE TaxID=554122 RepID=UPI0039A0CEDD